MNYFRHVPIRYRSVLITAGVMATLFLVQAYMHHYVYQDLKEMGEFRWLREAPVPFLNFFFWALLCPLVYSILQRWPFSERPLYRTLSIHIGLGLLIAALHEVVTSTIYYGILQALGDFDFRDPKYREWAYHALIPAVFSRTMEYWVLMGVLSALEGARLRREEQEQLLRLRNELQVTQLNALKKQLQPHFLFNTLNTVSALVDEDVKAARRVLSRLGALLRITLDKEQRDVVPLSRELEHTGYYLDIEGVRFRDRLRVHYEVPEELRHALVPNMVLQPLVENAIKHGPGFTSDPVDIHIRAKQRNGSLVLHVEDNGRGCADTIQVSTKSGIGLSNTRERLRVLYGEQAILNTHSPEGRGFHVEIALPLTFEHNGHETHPDHHR
ncbi:MAG: histidine kinase [Flavobacteriales bacterium]|nr:histidine kinase [Flavobacteriales bacterium]